MRRFEILCIFQYLRPISTQRKNIASLEQGHRMMICTEKPLTQNQSLLEKTLNTKQQQKLVARCQTVDDKLICQWIF